MVPEGLNVNAALLIHLEIQLVDQAAIATLLFVAALRNYNPLAVADLVVVWFLRHDAAPP